MFSPRILTHAGPLLERYDVLFSDIWGVVHDGVRVIPSCNEALIRFRLGGGTVILVSNAPVPPGAVAKVLDEKQVARTAWDRIVSSGGLALDEVERRGYRRLHRIGPSDRDAALFDALPPEHPLETCEAIVCSGPFDDRRETGEDYRARLIAPAARGVPMICANPDLHVHVGPDLLPCAGAIGVVYESLGGPVVWAGKPHRLAYAAAFEAATAVRDQVVAADRVLAIGDAVRTDLAAAAGAGVDALFVTSGIHRDAIMRDGRIDAAALTEALRGGGYGAVAAIDALRW